MWRTPGSWARCWSPWLRHSGPTRPGTGTGSGWGRSAAMTSAHSSGLWQRGQHERRDRPEWSSDQLAMIDTLVSRGAQPRGLQALTPERFVQFCEAWLQMDDRINETQCVACGKTFTYERRAGLRSLVQLNADVSATQIADSAGGLKRSAFALQAHYDGLPRIATFSARAVSVLTVLSSRLSRECRAYRARRGFRRARPRHPRRPRRADRRRRLPHPGRRCRPFRHARRAPP